MIAGGLVTSLLALIGSALDFATGSALVITAILGIAAGSLDLSGINPPTPTRQVNENWIGRYRGWVYGAAFGAQLGVGFSVFVMSWGYYAMLGAALVTGSWVAGAVIGAVFGLGRGILLLLAGFVNQPQELARFHRRLMEVKGPAFFAAGSAMVAAGVLGLL
jgi:sulfite exporter TauE/SafE